MTIAHEAIQGLASPGRPGYGEPMTCRLANLNNRPNNLNGNRNNNCGESVRARRNGDQA